MKEYWRRLSGKGAVRFSKKRKERKAIKVSPHTQHLLDKDYSDPREIHLIILLPAQSFIILSPSSHPPIKQRTRLSCNMNFECRRKSAANSWFFTSEFLGNLISDCVYQDKQRFNYVWIVLPFCVANFLPLFAGLLSI